MDFLRKQDKGPNGDEENLRATSADGRKSGMMMKDRGFVEDGVEIVDYS